MTIDRTTDRQNGRAMDITGRLVLSLTVFLSVGGVIFTSLRLYSLPINLIALIITGVIGCMCGTLLLCKIESRPLYVAALLFLLMASIIVFNEYAKNTWLMVTNRFMDTLSLRYGRIFPIYHLTVPEDKLTLCTMTIFIPFTAALSMFSALIAQDGLVAPMTALLLATLGSVIVGFSVFDGWCLLLAFASLMVAYRRRTLREGGGAIMALYLTISILAGLLALSKPLMASSGFSAANLLKAEIAALVDTARYGQPSSALPQGKLHSLPHLVFSTEPALEVTMSTPESLYLRGFVGEVYTGIAWQGLSPAARYENAGLFYWLHDYLFYGQSQLASLASATDDTEANAPIDIGVNNIGASPKYVYAPYELLAGNANVLDANAIGDSGIRASGFSGQTVYSYSALPNQVRRYNELSRSLFKSQDGEDPSITQYLDSEQAYRQYVYEQYIPVPEQAGMVLATHFGAAEYSGMEHMPYSEAKQLVFSYLSENIEYSGNPRVIGAGEDFFQAFIERVRAGYSVHYATAAALIFRHVGIPARYVEGYIITPGEAQRATGGEAIVLTGENEHAWVEYYEDGIGWIPFEVTPPYSEVMERADVISYADTIPDGATGDFSLDGSNTQGEDSGDAADAEELPEEVADRTRANLRIPILKILLLLFPLLLAAAVIIQIVRRSRVLKLRRESFNSENTADAICSIFAYSMRLIYLSGISRKNCFLNNMLPEIEDSLSRETYDSFSSCLEVHHEARFSNHIMREESRNKMQLLMEHALIDLRRRCSRLKRLKLQWIDFIY